MKWNGHLYYILRDIFYLCLIDQYPCTKPFCLTFQQRILHWEAADGRFGTRSKIFRQGEIKYSLNTVHTSTICCWKYACHAAEEQEGNFKQWKQYKESGRRQLHWHLGRLLGKLKACWNRMKPGATQDMHLEAVVSALLRPFVGASSWHSIWPCWALWLNQGYGYDWRLQSKSGPLCGSVVLPQGPCEINSWKTMSNLLSALYYHSRARYKRIMWFLP